MNCKECEGPERKLWVLFGDHRKPRLEDVQTGNWLFLRCCVVCHARWCCASYEPYASFSYGAAWLYGDTEWSRIHALDEGRTLHRWLDFTIAQQFAHLPDPELRMVEFHRHRSYGRNPIDEPVFLDAEDFSGPITGKV